MHEVPPVNARLVNGMMAVAAAAILVAGLHPAAAQTERKRVRVSDSTTVYSLALDVAAEFAQASGLPTPIVEPTGTKGAIALFCGGIGTLHPDLGLASRSMSAAERERCARNGVTRVVEMPLGYDALALVLPRGVPTFAISREELWLALAAAVPSDGTTVPNPYRTWRDVSASLPDWPIRVIGPSQRSGRYDALKSLIFDAACARSSAMRAVGDAAARRAACDKLSPDGRYVEETRMTVDISRRIGDSSAPVLGIVQVREIDEYAGKIVPISVDGVVPSYDSINDGNYPLSRTFRIFIKVDHLSLVPGVWDFAMRFFADDVSGSGGAFARSGLVPIPLAVRRNVVATATGERDQLLVDK
jgi:phosphate transport system substrate-binding protein